MNAEITLRPGQASLAELREIYRGAAVLLDPVARIDVEAGKAALSAIQARNGPEAGSAEPENGAPTVSELIESRGDPLPTDLLRLFVALKLGALAQGISGVRWSVVKGIADFLDRGLVPAVPLGADDRMALPHLFGALTGTGMILKDGAVRPANEALNAAGSRLLNLNPRERSALVSGMELSTATALARLFQAERILQAAIAATALSASAGGESVYHLGVYRLHRQPGPLDVAASVHTLAGNGSSEHAPRDARGMQLDTRSVFRIGAALDLLRQAGLILERAANSVSEDVLVLWQSEELVPGGANLTALALATDLIALALTTVGDAAAPRIAAPDAAGVAGMLATRLADSREHAGTPVLDSGAMGRIAPLIETVSEIVALALLAAAQAVAADEPAAGLAAALALVREVETEFGGMSDAAIAALAARIRSGEFPEAAGTDLPSVEAAAPARPARADAGRGR